jgi:nitrite reductase/ring-hydroxylating ferredoxin subunit
LILPPQLFNVAGPLAIAGGTQISGLVMDLPASIAALGAQLTGAGQISPDPALFSDPNVFAAERERIFVRPLMAVDHETRLTQDGYWFRSDAGPRSLVVTRDSEGRLRALRNLCIHAGYPVCHSDEGAAERLICPYHGWEYALDGKLVEPELSSRIDPSRLRMASYPVSVHNGLIFVDPSGKTNTGEFETAPVPAWLSAATVTGRASHSTTWNWKILRQLLQSSPQLVFADLPEDRLDFGPLSFMFVNSHRAALVRIIPKFAEQTDCQIVDIAAEEAAAGKVTSDDWAERLRSVDPSPTSLDRQAADWYWSLMSQA